MAVILSATSSASSRSASSGVPPDGTRPSKLRAEKLVTPVPRLQTTSARPSPPPPAKRQKQKSTSALPGAFEANHHRHRSAGNTSSAASVNTPRRWLVENLPL